jgi:MFS transporter, CP family, cyanate transporter
MSKSSKGLVIAFALLFITIILRPPVAAIGPLLQEIADSLNLNQSQVGLLAAAPVLCFGIGAFASPWLVRKFGINKTMTIVLVILVVSIIGRVFFGFSALLLGTISAGLSIAVANVLLPTLVRKWYPARVPLVTGLYTTVLAISASFAAAIAVPSSEALGGWPFALGIWILPAALALLLWLPASSGLERETVQLQGSVDADRRAVNRSPLAWAIVAFFGIQSLGFYVILGWLPTMLISIGLSATEAGTMLGFATIIGVPSGFLLAPILGRVKSLAPLAIGASSLTLVGYLLLTQVIAGQAASATWLIYLACAVIGVGQSATFPISLSLIGTRATSSAQTTRLSAMAQGWGYLLAAIGTFAVGALVDILGSWLISLLMLVALTAVQAVAGYFSGRPGQISSKS